MKRYPHNLSHTETSTINMGTCIPSNIIEVFPGDSFRIQAKDLTRLLPQVAPTMHDVFVGIDTYQTPLRQIFEKLHLDWDTYLTGGEDGTTVVDLPQIVIPESGYEPGSLADFLGYPTNWTDPSTGEQHTGVCAGQEFSAIPVLVYMHIINENYRDQNFIKKFDFTKYQDFLDGTYQFEDAQGNPIEYDLQREGLFPKAWSRDYYGRAMPNTQRGPQARIPLGESADLQPTTAPLVERPGAQTTANNSSIAIMASQLGLEGSPAFDFNLFGVTGTGVQPQFSLYSFVVGTGHKWLLNTEIKVGTVSASDTTWEVYMTQTGFNVNNLAAASFTFVRVAGSAGLANVTTDAVTFGAVGSTNIQLVDLAGVKTNLSEATAAGMIAFRTAARMQQCGEWLQDAGARAVEFTLKFFGVRIPDDRVQRPIFHGSFRMPIVFSEVLQTSQTSDTSPLATLGGHGITGGVNRPIHIKVIEHGFIMSIMHVMPRSQFQNIIPKYLLRKTRWDMPNPLFQGIGEQPLLRKEIYPESQNPDETFGYIPQFAELMSIPSTLHGHMKDTFLHWTMARVYTSEPVLSAAWRYEKPSDRSFAVQGEDQMQVCIGYEINSRRKFKNNPRPGIHVI